MGNSSFKKYKCVLLLFQRKVYKQLGGSFLIALLCISCNNGKTSSVNKLFTQLSSDQTGVPFSNTIQYTEDFNPYTFRNFFNGGGVAIGDINNDGLPDIFFCSNQQSNKLYLNKGNFQFEDITLKAGVTSDGIWS